jgi:hypothetical protein
LKFRRSLKSSGILITVLWTSTRIWPIVKCLPVSLRKLIEPLEPEASNFWKFSGVITPKRKPLGNEKITFRKNFPIFSVLN